MPDFTPNIPSPTSLYPQPPPAGGVLGNPSGVLDMFGKVQSYERTQRDIAAQQAIGEAVTRNTDPATGAIDQAGFARDIMTNPAARWKAQEAFTTMYQQQEAMQRIGAAQMARIHQELGALPPDFNDEQKNRAVLNLHSLPGMNPLMIEAAANQIEPMPRSDDRSPEADRIRWRRNDIVAGHRKAQMTPEQLEAPRDVYVDPYTKMLVPGAAYLRPGMPGAPGAAAPGTAGAYTPPGYTGGPGLTFTPQQQELLTESGKLGTQLLNSRDKLSQEHQLLTELKVLGQQLDRDFTGSQNSSEFEKHIRAIKSRLEALTGEPIDDRKLSNAELYDKILNQVIGSQRGQGADSVADLGVIQASNPRLEMTPYAKEGAVNQLLAMNEFREAMRQEFEAAGGARRPSFYTEWRNQPHNREVLDPSVFAFNRMRPEEKEAYFRKLSPQRQRALEERHNYAVSRGWAEPLR